MADMPRSKQTFHFCVFAGVQAAPEVVKLVLCDGGARGRTTKHPRDFGFDYSRHEILSFAEPRRGDCPLCVQGRDWMVVAELAQGNLLRVPSREL